MVVFDSEGGFEVEEGPGFIFTLCTARNYQNENRDEENRRITIEKYVIYPCFARARMVILRARWHFCSLLIGVSHKSFPDEAPYFAMATLVPKLECPLERQMAPPRTTKPFAINLLEGHLLSFLVLDQQAAFEFSGLSVLKKNKLPQLLTINALTFWIDKLALETELS
ncbi:DNA-directed RNA polymerase subunit beta' [Striga asiatica]|uniref:DNA-directed RNA polymerase subunit beta n=1 Tax=Striga asiatica TaxID=4170 RepID=A0A5A7P6C4_STRAF|nr:DNA-directed RNA polymerase subunit beta' [Striga asiatica]